MAGISRAERERRAALTKPESSEEKQVEESNFLPSIGDGLVEEDFEPEEKQVEEEDFLSPIPVQFVKIQEVIGLPTEDGLVEEESEQTAQNLATEPPELAKLLDLFEETTEVEPKRIIQETFSTSSLSLEELQGILNQQQDLSHLTKNG